jgi:hypothetical protein
MNDALRGGHGEVGVLKLGNDDNWEVPLEGPYDPADEEGREETETAGGRRAMRVGPKTRRDAHGASEGAKLSHLRHNRVTHSNTHSTYAHT